MGDIIKKESYDYEYKEKDGEAEIILIGSDSLYEKGERVFKFKLGLEDSENRIPDGLLLKALELSGGNISRAARNIGINRSVYHDRCRNVEGFREKLDEIREVKLDIAEDVLWSYIEEHNLIATMFFLKTIGKNRGYTSQTEIVGNKEKPVTININVGGEEETDEYS